MSHPGSDRRKSSGSRGSSSKRSGKGGRGCRAPRQRPPSGSKSAPEGRPPTDEWFDYETIKKFFWLCDGVPNRHIADPMKSPFHAVESLILDYIHRVNTRTRLEDELSHMNRNPPPKILKSEEEMVIHCSDLRILVSLVAGFKEATFAIRTAFENAAKEPTASNQLRFLLRYMIEQCHATDIPTEEILELGPKLPSLSTLESLLIPRPAHEHLANWH